MECAEKQTWNYVSNLPLLRTGLFLPLRLFHTLCSVDINFQEIRVGSFQSMVDIIIKSFISCLLLEEEEGEKEEERMMEKYIFILSNIKKLTKTY